MKQGCGIQPGIVLVVLLVAGGWLAARSDAGQGADEPLWRHYPGGDGPGRAKRVVLISGDEEYRSEQAMPMLARILSKHHGFDCTVLFAVDPQRRIVQPNERKNIPGLEALAKADLMVMFTRFRDLPDEQMQRIEAYLMSGRPVIGIRTATHAFKIPPGGKWSHYSYHYRGEKSDWRGGFGRLVLGETWISHHGLHKHESTRGLPAPGAADHPILRGIDAGDIWVDTDVYTVRLPLPGDSRPLVLGQVLAGMQPDAPPVTGAKNEPMLPVAWTRTYRLPGGRPGRAFTTTMGAATDFVNPALRRLLVNAVYWCVGLAERIPAAGTNVDLVGAYRPSRYGFLEEAHWLRRSMRPGDIP